MGSSTSKVGLLPEPSAKSGYFSFMKSVVSFNKNKNFDEDLRKPKKRAEHPWSQTQGHVSDGAATKKRQANKAEVKFRTTFDPRVTARYDIKALIGRGSFSYVVRVEHKHTRQPFAIKMLEVRGLDGQGLCRTELGVLRRVRHANIIRLAEVFETSDRVYLVLELATGGELLERVVARGSFTERDATRALIMVSSGLCYIHSLGIIHRDLKPENLLYYHPGPDSRLIITDFGLACWSTKSQSMGGDGVAVRDTCGTESAEEIVHKDRSMSDRGEDIGGDGGKSCNIAKIKGQGTVDDCRRLIDDRKARESSQERGVAIAGNERGDANGCLVSRGDERERDESLGFDGTGKDSSGVENEGSSATALHRGTKRDRLETSPADVSESFKVINLYTIGKTKKDEILGQDLHDRLKDKRQNDCIESKEDKVVHYCATASPNVVSTSRKGQDWALRTMCGTPEYLAPEMVGGKPYGSAVDMWALGVISYVLLSGSMPFDQRSRPRLFRAILRGSYSFHCEPWNSVSNQAKDFIERLLSLSPDHRMTAQQALTHPWLVSMASDSSNRNLHRPISQNLRQRTSRASARSNSPRSASGSRSAASPRSHSGHESCQLDGNRLQRMVVVSTETHRSCKNRR